MQVWSRLTLSVLLKSERHGFLTRLTMELCVRAAFPFKLWLENDIALGSRARSSELVKEQQREDKKRQIVVWCMPMSNLAF
mmetsp:Transcript_182/g.474  ORF Transcript_182/g.474 Transcript_182/m.474 type:complete len:81 (+) Transcript_182:1251-1493(+)